MDDLPQVNRNYTCRRTTPTHMAHQSRFQLAVIGQPLLHVWSRLPSSPLSFSVIDEGPSEDSSLETKGSIMYEIKVHGIELNAPIFPNKIHTTVPGTLTRIRKIVVLSTVTLSNDSYTIFDINDSPRNVRCFVKIVDGCVTVDRLFGLKGSDWHYIVPQCDGDTLKSYQNMQIRFSHDRRVERMDKTSLRAFDIGIFAFELERIRVASKCVLGSVKEVRWARHTPTENQMIGSQQEMKGLHGGTSKQETIESKENNGNFDVFTDWEVVESDEGDVEDDWAIIGH